MDAGTFSLLLALGSLAGGFLGALTGLGGGVVLVPLLTLVFGVDLRYAIGASLVSVIATSSAAAASHVRDGYSNVRVGMFLEVATTIGAVVGAMIATWVPVSAVAVVFGIVLLWSSITSLRRRADGTGPAEPDRVATLLRLDGSFPSASGVQTYHVAHVPGGFALMFMAGGLSGLLGIGSGALKVLAMDQVMGLPFKVSTTTSNFMIGVTAAASAGLYLHRGYIDPALTMPVMLGVLVGASLGARLLAGARVSVLRFVFAFVIMALGAQMVWHGLSGASRMSDRDLDVALGHLLRIGVLLAAVVTFVGGVLWLRQAHDTVVGWRAFRGEPVHLEHVGTIVTAAREGEATAVIQLGILLLIGTPIARVLFSLVSFAIERDRLYVATTLMVLTVLLWSLVGVRR